MSLAEKTLQKARIVHAAFFLTSILYMLIPMVAFKTQTKEVRPAIILAISFVAVSDMGMGIVYRNKFSPPLTEALARNLDDAAASRKWFIGVVRSFVFCEMNLVRLGTANLGNQLEYFRSFFHRWDFAATGLDAET